MADACAREGHSSATGGQAPPTEPRPITPADLPAVRPDGSNASHPAVVVTSEQLLDGTRSQIGRGLDEHIVLINVSSDPAEFELQRLDGPIRWRARVGTISFIPAGVGTVRIVLGGARVLSAALPPPFVAFSCGEDVQPTWRLALAEERPKSWAALRAITGRPKDGRAIARLLDRLLARTLAADFGGVRFRADDAWLSPAALSRVALAVAAGGNRLGVGALAREAGLSVSAFSRAFRGATGLTAGDWLIEERMLVAERLLAETDLGMADVAARSGMAGAAHLAQLFRAKRGITPGAFRTQARPDRRT